jgi:hypothetical protein
MSWDLCRDIYSIDQKNGQNFQIFLLVRNVFVCFKLFRNQNRTFGPFVFSKNDIKTNPKRYKLRQGFLKTKQNFLLFQKKFGNGPDQKLLDQIFLVLIENVLFRSRILFQKLIYSIFFGTKAAKRKLSILKERWFDIASAGIEDTTYVGTDVVFNFSQFKLASKLSSQKIWSKGRCQRIRGWAGGASLEEEKEEPALKKVQPHLRTRRKQEDDKKKWSDLTNLTKGLREGTSPEDKKEEPHHGGWEGGTLLED